MSGLPAAVARHLERERLGEAGLLVLRFDADWRLQERFVQGPDFGLSALDDESVGELFQALLSGYSRVAGTVLERVTLPSGAVADLHTLSHGKDVYVLLVDRAAEHAREREHQQAAQEARLEAGEAKRQRRLLRSELVRAHKALELLQIRHATLLSVVEWTAEELRRDPATQWLAQRLADAAGFGGRRGNGAGFSELVAGLESFLDGQTRDLGARARLAVVGAGSTPLQLDAAAARACLRLAVQQALLRCPRREVRVELRLEPSLVRLMVADSALLSERERRCLWDRALPDLRQEARVERCLYALGHELAAAGGRATYADTDGVGVLTVSLPHGTSLSGESTQNLRSRMLRGRRLWVALKDPAASPTLSAELDATGAEWTPVQPQAALVATAIKEAPDAILLEAVAGARLAKDLRTAGYRGRLLALGDWPDALAVRSAFDATHADGDGLARFLIEQIARPR